MKIYDPNSDLKVCDVCDFVGVLSLDQPQGKGAVVRHGEMGVGETISLYLEINAFRFSCTASLSRSGSHLLSPSFLVIHKCSILSIFHLSIYQLLSSSSFLLFILSYLDYLIPPALLPPPALLLSPPPPPPLLSSLIQRRRRLPSPLRLLRRRRWT